MVITGFGISLYQTPNVGTAPYDSLSLIMAKSGAEIPYFGTGLPRMRSVRLSVSWQEALWGLGRW